MKRPVIITLRVLAIGSALTALTCQVASRQKLAKAAAGDPGTPGPPALPSGARQTWAPSSKSLHAVIHPAGTPSTGVPPELATASRNPPDQTARAVAGQAGRHFRQGLHYYDVGRYAEAALEFKRVVAIDAQNSAALRALERAQQKIKPAVPPANPVPSSPPPATRAAAARRLLHYGSKSAPAITPDDLRQMQQRSNQQVPAQQSVTPQR